jgi:NTE family protein
MRANPLSAVPTLAGCTLKDLEALATGAEQLALRRGEVLVRQGEPSDALYFVLSGRFTVHRDGAVEPIAEVAQGQPIGEIGFFAGLPRTATVVALRDSRVLAITRDRFHEIGESSPGLRDTLIVSLARRLSEGRPAKLPTLVRTVAVMPAGGSPPSQAFVDALRNVFGSSSRTLFLTEAEIAARFPGVPLDDPAISNWLNAAEIDSEFILYIAGHALTDWTMKCIRQADALVLVAAAGASVELSPSERFAFSILPLSARRLVVLHQARTEIVSGTAAWLERRDVFMHHHVALQDESDVRRLFRFLSGRALGFVAGGGGALGSAHLGAYKAFCEAGADFDILGGTSAGAAMMAAFACGADAERVDQGTRNIFVRSRAFRRPTLPRYGLIDHKVFDRALRAEYGDAIIEDLWKPFFAVSSNLSDHKPRIHRRGLVWHAVRASGSVPGMLPPFFTREGEMLVDGALMDNVPLAPMKALKSGPNVIVMLGVDAPTTYAVDYQSIPGPRELAAAMLNPFARRRLPQAPGIIQVIMLSMLANRPYLELSDSDILIRPELPDDLRFTSWERHNEIFLHAYRQTAAWIEARMADPAVRAVIGHA